jgi:uncharacterized membrane protein
MPSILILLNNYLHDLAAAVLISSAILMFLLAREVTSHKNPELSSLFVTLYRKFTWVAIGSLVMIVLGGIVRTITYRQFEWASAVGRGQVTALVIKHIILFTLVGVGIYLWIELARKVREIEKGVGDSSLTHLP